MAVPLLTRAEKGAPLSSAEADNVILALREMRELIDALGGVSFTGAWQPGRSYLSRQGASFAGSSYLSVSPHTAGDDFEADLAEGLWLLYAAAGEDATGLVWRTDVNDGFWDGTTAYVVGNAVMSEDGLAWRSIQPGTGQEPAEGSTYWAPLFRAAGEIEVDATADYAVNSYDWLTCQTLRLDGVAPGGTFLDVPSLARAPILIAGRHSGAPVTLRVDGEADSGFALAPSIEIWVRCDGETLFPVGPTTDLEGRVTALEGGDSGVLKGSKTYDPPNLFNGSGTSTTVTVTGARPGDPAHAALSSGSGGLEIWAEILTDDTATVYLYNETGGSVNRPSGSLNVVVFSFS